MTPTEEQRQAAARLRSRNLALGGLLIGLAVLFFAITIARMG